jgi:bidirectional [NiFe] hydrogenase diaphorase subunit
VNRAELQGLKEKTRQAQMQQPLRFLVCYSTPCLSSGAPAVRQTLEEGIAAGGMKGQVAVKATGCMGPCSRGPLVAVQRPGEADVIYENVTPELARQILERHQGGTGPVATAVLAAGHPFFTRQNRWVLENSGRIDPQNVADYVGRDGYAALAHVLHEMSPEEVCAAIVRSGLRGRGGGGYPTGLKWQLMFKAPGERKFVVANGDEGDPGAYMDRTLMESDPHRILEGMAIAGYAVGADKGYIYVRGEYPVAAQRLEKAIRDAERVGILGARVLDSGFRFRIDLRLGAGAFVCGEETSLMASIMGRRGFPSPRPPYPAQRGLWGYPTLINNVETFGAVPAIIRRGADAFAAIGTARSKGTKIFALAGEVTNSGLIEVSMGITLREIVEEIGGGMAGGQAFKAAQTGGPSGGCIPPQHLDTPVDYESLMALGSIMGSGGLIVMGEKSCMVDVAKYFMDFCLDESCGKCVPCRVGTVQMYRLLDRISNGSATEADLERLEELCALAKEGSLCGLGGTAPNPVLSTLRYFRDEYLAHIRERRCPAGVCRMAGLPRVRLPDEHLRQIHAARSDMEGI